MGELLVSRLAVRGRRLVQCGFVTAIFLFSLTSPTKAADACEPVVGRVASAEGNVEFQRGADAPWTAAKLNQVLCEGDSVRAAERSRAAITLANQAVLRVDQNSAVRLVNISSKPEERSFVDLLRGAIQSFSRKPRRLEVSTPYLNGTIEGTEFVLRVADNQTILTVFEGTVRAANQQGSVAVTSGHSVAAAAGKAPQPRTVVRPRDAAQWALYYPPVPSDDSGLQLAAQDLSVGRVDEARAGIAKALVADPNNGSALALRSVMHTVQNNRAEAMADAQKAIAASPDRTGPWVALSYAQQAGGDIAGARTSARTASEKQPKDAFAWARLAELELMMGERRRSAQAADTAVQLAPNLSRAYLARGFAAITERRIADASAAFEKAIALDSADPLPHLGLGIARINTGDLENGRRELEVAVAMDSNNALYRAYLGKAYFEEKRRVIDAEQLAIAKELDPQDPTAYFYNAIRLQTENQPVPALKEVDASIERNDNRAVYRSRLLLDSDEAARSAGLARVYNDLGFQQLALVEGWKSVNTDPSDSSAHRFLADSYSVLPRHEIARVSELLQSQLLDPLNLAAIQPRAAESVLGLISAGGPAIASANEFNSLFKRNQANVIVNGMSGEMGTGSGEVVVGGISSNWAVSVGLSRFTTDGFRPNNDQTDSIGNAFIQAALSPATSVQFEYRRRETENGDLNLHMDGTFSEAHRNKQQSDTYRVGLRHAFSANSILLASVMHKVEDNSFYDEPVPGVVSLLQESPANRATGTELQYLYRANRYSVIAGAGYFDLDQSETTTQNNVFLPFPPFSFTATADLSAKHKNAYVYSNIRVLPAVTLALGVSHDSFDTQDPLSDSRDQTNPKVGITWQVQPGTTLRAAAFRVLKRSLITDQTLEPTQVAGFNQFYYDIPSSDVRTQGIALDQKFSRTVFGGAEVTRRDLNVPITYNDFSGFPPIQSVIRTDWQEDMGRLYLFMTPMDRVALSIEYLYERHDWPLTSSLGDSVSETIAHKVPVGIQYFSPLGWTLGVKQTFVRESHDTGPTASVNEQDTKFSVVDAMVSYRLPKRRGFVSVGATNLTDRHFAYEQLDSRNVGMQPARMIFGRLSLSLP